MESDLILSDHDQSLLPSSSGSPVIPVRPLIRRGLAFLQSESWRKGAVGASGYLWGLGAAAIWSGWWTVTRVGVVDDLPATDLAALRFCISGLLLLPLAWRERLVIGAVAPRFLVLMAAGAGAPYALVAGTGVRLTSAGLGGAITVGLLPVFTLILSVLFLREKVTPRLAAGIGGILAGAALVIAGAGEAERGGYGLGLFVVGALMWAGYTVALRRSGLSPLTATAVICVTSFVLYTPVWLALSGPSRLLVAAPGELLLQLVYQSLLSAIGALYCYGRAIGRLGATRASVFAAIVPLFSVLIAAAVLHEIPDAFETCGAVLLSGGAFVASSSRR